MLYNILLIPSLFVLFLLNPIKNLHYQQIKTVIDGQNFNLYIADTPFKHSKGLMFINKMDKNDGMIFVFNKASRPAFYNKNVRFPLTFLWLDNNGRVVDMTTLPKNTFKVTKPRENINYVIEVQEGVVDYDKIIDITIKLNL